MIGRPFYPSPLREISSLCRYPLKWWLRFVGYTIHGSEGHLSTVEDGPPVDYTSSESLAAKYYYLASGPPKFLDVKAIDQARARGTPVPMGGLEDEIHDISDPRNGLLLALQLHRPFGAGEIVFLKDDIPTSSGPDANNRGGTTGRFTIQHLVQPSSPVITFLAPHNLDARLVPEDTSQWPHAMITDLWDSGEEHKRKLERSGTNTAITRAERYANRPGLDPLAEDRETNDIHVYLASSPAGKLYAAKIQKIGQFATLDQEIEVYKAFANNLRALFAALSAMLDQKLPPTFVAFFASDMIAALEFIHLKDIIHCDIRPANFLCGTRSDGSNGVVLIDFEASNKAGKRRSGPAQYTGDAFFASAHMLRKRRRPQKGDDGRTVKSKSDYVEACEVLAQVKLSTEDSCCQDLPPLFDVFLRDTRNVSDSAFDYKWYASEFDRFVKDNERTCLLELAARGMLGLFQ